MKIMTGFGLMGSAIVLFLTLDASSARAGDEAGYISTATAATSEASNTPEQEEAVIKKLSYRYQVQKDITRQLRHELGGWDEVSTALVIAQKAKKKADHILALKKSSMSWDQIMESYTVDKNVVRDEVISVMREIGDWEK